jgi:hypothetical protein
MHSKSFLINYFESFSYFGPDFCNIICEMKATNSILLLCTALIVLANGCASTGESRTIQPLSVKLGQFKTAYVQVTSAMPKPPAKLDEFMVQLESRIIAKLRTEKTFANIYSAADASPSELQIAVKITSVRDIDNLNRMMWGAFAGQANTRATVELRDRASGGLLGSVQVKGKSSGGSILAGTTAQAVDRVADEVVRLIRANM